jgi:hypothetical protein
MAGIVSASWLRLIPLRDFDLRLFGTATTRISEHILYWNRPVPGTVRHELGDSALGSWPSMHEIVHGTNEKEYGTGIMRPTQGGLPNFGSAIEASSCDSGRDRLI